MVQFFIHASQAMMISFIICSSSTASRSTAAAINSSKPRGLDNIMCLQDKQWFCFNSITRAYSCNQAAVSGRITCSNNGPIMEIGSCATYDESTQVLSFSMCSNQAEVNDYDRSTIFWYIQLPTVLTELNDYMCGPLNRKGLVCSECADGFGPSVTSFGYSYKCINCTNAGYGVVYFFLSGFSQLLSFISSF